MKVQQADGILQVSCGVAIRLVRKACRASPHVYIYPLDDSRIYDELVDVEAKAICRPGTDVNYKMHVDRFT